jgi:hypothetical protein
MSQYTRRFHFNTKSFADGQYDTAEGKSFRDALQQQVNALDGAWGAELSQYTLTVTHLTEVVTATELDELVLSILHGTAKTHGSLFPYVTSDGKLRRKTDEEKDATELKDFEICPNYNTNWGYEQLQSVTKGRQVTIRVYELNALIAGLIPGTNQYNDAAQAQFANIVGGHAGAIPAVYAVEVTHTRVKVTFYSDLTPIKVVDKRMKAILTEVFAAHPQFFPHLRLDGKELEIREFTAS